MTKIGELLLVEVPKFSMNHCLNGDKILYRFDNGSWGSVPFNEPDLIYILGLITENEIGFDCEPYVELDPSMGFKNYDGGTTPFGGVGGSFILAKSSFRSLLSSHGIFFKNPLGENKPPLHSMPSSYENISDGELSSMEYHHERAVRRRKKWEDYQSKVIKGNLLALLHTE